MTKRSGFLSSLPASRELGLATCLREVSRGRTRSCFLHKLGWGENIPARGKHGFLTESLRSNVSFLCYMDLDLFERLYKVPNSQELNITKVRVTVTK